MQPSIRDHQIFELLLFAHIEREVGTDLIEEYFARESSLDQVTKCAQMLLEESEDPEERKAVLKNLSECIVVKVQRDKQGLVGFVRKALSKMGFKLHNSEIRRAEFLIKSSLPVSSRDFSRTACADE